MTFRESFIEEGRVEGRVEGRDEGVLIGQQKVANSFMEHGMSIDNVSNITGIEKELLELWSKQKD